MTTTPTTPEARSNRLPILAETIKGHLAAAEQATRRGLEHAIAAGARMMEAKELVPHGKWLEWLQENCRVGARQAQTFMRLARNRHKLEAIKNESTAHLTIAAAEAFVGKPRPERPRGLPGQLDMLGGPEVTAHPAAPALRGRALFDLIVDLEQALRIIKQDERRAQGDKHRSRLRATISTVAATIEYLKSQHLKAQRRRQRRAAR